MNDSIKKGLKEGGRVAVLGILSYLLTEGVISTVVQYFVGTRLDQTSVLQIVGLMTTGLKALDKYLHDLGTVTDNTTLAKGITQF